jgi:signal peptidase
MAMTTVRRETEGSTEPSVSAARTGGRRLVDVALTVAALGGVLCILLVIAASVFHITLIMFKTGSMSPTIPAGSLAVVKEIPASEARVGDVVTISRPGELPITHRVTSATAQGGGTVVITMKGDANDFEDPAPYVVDTVRIVIFSVPGLASLVIAVSNPFVLGGITLAAALLVSWAFWPRGPGHGHGRGRRADRGGTDRVDHRHGRRSAARGAAGTALAVVALAMVPTLVAPSAARADEIVTTVRGQYLTLMSIGDPEVMGSLTPARPTPWQVGVTVAPPEPGTVHIGLSAVGELTDPGELALDVRACDHRWVDGVCAGGEALWLARQDLAAAVVPAPVSAENPDGAREIGRIGVETVWLMLRVVLQGTTEPGSALNLRLHAWGGGDVAVVGDPGSDGGGAGAARAGGGLAFTGFGGQVPLLLAVLSVSLGLAFAAAARRRRENRG